MTTYFERKNSPEAEPVYSKPEYLEYIYADFQNDIYMNLKNASLNEGDKKLSILFDYYASKIAQDYYKEDLKKLIKNLLDNPAKIKDVRYAFRGCVNNIHCWLLLKVSTTHTKHAFISLTKLDESYNKSSSEIAATYC